MTASRQAARAHARETQQGAPVSAEFLELVAGAVAVAVQRAIAELQLQPACAVCVSEAKIRQAIATKSLEPPPEVSIRQSITVIDGRPVCWEHADAEKPKTLNELRGQLGYPRQELAG